MKKKRSHELEREPGQIYGRFEGRKENREIMYLYYNLKESKFFKVTHKNIVCMYLITIT